MQALLVFILYVRCTAINPADTGIMSKFQQGATNKPRIDHHSSAKNHPGKLDEFSGGLHSSQSSPSKSSTAAPNSGRKFSVGDTGIADASEEQKSKGSCVGIGGIFCALFVHEDCRKQDETADVQDTSGEALFCTLCNAEVSQSTHYYVYNT